MKKINIIINNRKFKAELNDTETAQRIYQALPITVRGNFWGNEIYFEIPVIAENEKPTENLKLGDLAYWPSGNAFCIFYGQTPASNNQEPKPASPVTIIGKIMGNLEELKRLNQAQIKIEKSKEE